MGIAPARRLPMPCRIALPFHLQYRPLPLLQVADDVPFEVLEALKRDGTGPVGKAAREAAWAAQVGEKSSMGCTGGSGEGQHSAAQVTGGVRRARSGEQETILCHSVQMVLPAHYIATIDAVGRLCPGAVAVVSLAFAPPFLYVVSPAYLPCVGAGAIPPRQPAPAIGDVF